MFMGMCRMRIRDLQILNGLRSDDIFEGDVLTVATGTEEGQAYRPWVGQAYRPCAGQALKAEGEGGNMGTEEETHRP